MIEWLKIQVGNGDTYLVNADKIAYISKDGIMLIGYGHLAIPVDVEEVDRVITESRKTGERWLNGEIN